MLGSESVKSYESHNSQNSYNGGLWKNNYMSGPSNKCKPAQSRAFKYLRPIEFWFGGDCLDRQIVRYIS